MPDIPDDIDLDADAIGGGSLELVSALAQKQQQLEEEVKALTQQLKEKQEELQTINRDKLPVAMDEVGIKRFTLNDGSEITIKDIVTATFPSDTAIEKADPAEREELVERRERCLEWLHSSGGSPIIKTAIIADFGKGQEELANRLKSFIQEEFGLDAQQKLNIHNGSLVKFIKEKMAQASDPGSSAVPLEDFKVFIGKESRIKPAGK